jgi:cobalt-zinc-cadmium efflux system protein
VILGALAIFIIAEAIGRLVNPSAVDGYLVMLFAGVILAVEGIGIAVLSRVQGESLNARSAFLHLVGDVASTIGVLVVGVVIHFGGMGFSWLDAVVSGLIAALLVYWAFRLIRESGHILMEGTPGEIDPESVRREIVRIEGVREVHDLHLWTLTSGLHTMSAHVVADHADPRPDIAEAVRHHIKEHFGLKHATVQLEDPRRTCADTHA